MTGSPFKMIALDFSRKGAPFHFTRAINVGMEDGFREFKIRPLRRGIAAYPNALVPIAGLIDHYQLAGLRFMPSRSLEADTYLRKVGIIEPHCDPDATRPLDFTDKVWRFTDDTHYDIVTGIINSLRATMPAERGVMQSLELCLNEVTDNVLNHSLEGATGEPCGFVMAQAHKRNRRIAITVFDYGVGIFKTLSPMHPELADPGQAIALALQKGVTSGAGRGNGLWILDRIVAEGAGSIDVSSGGARYSLHHASSTAPAKPSISKVTTLVPGTTMVDFQLDMSRPVEISSVLQGHNPVNLWMEMREDDGLAAIRLAMRDESQGFGTRMAGRQMRTLVRNVLADTDGDVILDFDGVEVMSTSYADELLAKTADDPGAGRIALANLNENTRLAIAEVVQRPLRVVAK